MKIEDLIEPCVVYVSPFVTEDRMQFAGGLRIKCKACTQEFFRKDAERDAKGVDKPGEGE